MKRNILIVSQFFYPTNNPRSLRTTELAKEFARQGHEVTILTPKDNVYHPKFVKEFGVTIKPLSRIDFNPPSKLYKKVNNESLFAPIRKYLYNERERLFHYANIKWLFKTRIALKIEKNYDLLITVAVPHPIHWGTSFVQTKKKPIAKTWVADCGDPFMGLENGKFKRYFYFKYIEKKWCKKADFIAVPFEGAIKAYYPEFHDKIKVIPQGLSFPKIAKGVKKNNNVPTFIYSGSIGPYDHCYIPFFNFLNSIKSNFRLIVYTREKNLIQKYTSVINHKIVINDYVSREVLINSFTKADFLVHFPYKQSSQKSLKLVDYHYSKTPILSYKGVDSNKNLEEFLKGNYDNKIHTENIDQNNIENVCKQFLEL